MKSENLSDLLIKRSRSDFEEKGVPSPEAGAGGSEKKASPGISLYEDTLSETRRRSVWGTWIWVSFAVLILGGMVAAYLLQAPGERIADSTPKQRVPSDPDSPLARIVEEVRSRPKEDSETSETSEVAPREQAQAPAPEETRNSDTPPKAVIEAPRAVPPEPKLESPVVETPRSAALRDSDDGGRAGPGQVPRDSVEASVSQPAPAAAVEAEPPAALVQSEPIQEPVEPSRDDLAYQALLSHSVQANRLVEGNYSTLQFKHWRVVQRTPSEVWIDLICAWTNGGAEVHFIWSINEAEGRVRPLSEAARNLSTAADS